MLIVHSAPRWACVRPWLSGLAATTLLLVALVGPATAHQGTADGYVAREGTARLREAGVQPRLARTSTTIHFQVTFSDPSGSAPVWVRVFVDGHARAMSVAATGRDYRLGVRFAGAARLSAGWHRIRFRARTADGSVVGVDGGRVKVVRATTSGGGSAGTTSSTTEPLVPAGVAGADAGDPTLTPETPPTRSPGAAAEQPGDESSSLDPTLIGSGWLPVGRRGALPDGAVDGADAAGPMTVGPAPVPVTAATGSTVPGGASGGSGGADAARALELLGVGRSLADQIYHAYPMLITSTGTVVLWAGFVIFGRRRQDGEPPAPDPVLAAHAASGPDPLPFTELVPPEAHPFPVPPGVDPDEASLPRWRRPSLMQARKTDPLRTASTAVPLTFTDGAVGPADGMERRRIRYRLVRLLDVPDEFRANEIGILDQGDEVELVEARGTYRFVVCPDGRQGWLHKMVLGDVVTDDRPADGSAVGIDEDMLAAFIAGRPIA